MWGGLDWHRSKISLYDWNLALFCSSWTSTIGVISLCAILDIFWHCQVITPSFQVKFKIWYNFHSKKVFFSNFWYIFQMFGTIFFLVWISIFLQKIWYKNFFWYEFFFVIFFILNGKIFKNNGTFCEKKYHFFHYFWYSC